MATKNPGIDPSNALRAALQTLNEFGISYSMIANRADRDFGWNAGNLKALVHRDGVIGRSPKVAELASIVRQIAEEQKFGSMQSPRLATDLRLIKYFMVGKSADLLISVDQVLDRIDDRIRSFRRASTATLFPEQQAFVRYDWSQRRIITVLVNCLRSSRGSIFSMKITGRTGLRRIVVGDVLSTHRNTYFSGLAYQINENIDQHSFINLNTFDLEELDFFTASNEMGLEEFAIQNNFLHFKTMPAAFMGLDGKGDPICGMGALLKNSLFEKYGISEDTFSSVECNDKSRLHELLIRIGGVTSHIDQDLLEE